MSILEPLSHGQLPVDAPSWSARSPSPHAGQGHSTAHAATTATPSSPAGAAAVRALFTGGSAALHPKHVVTGASSRTAATQRVVRTRKGSPVSGRQRRRALERSRVLLSAQHPVGAPSKVLDQSWFVRPAVTQHGEVALKGGSARLLVCGHTGIVNDVAFCPVPLDNHRVLQAFRYSGGGGHSTAGDSTRGTITPSHHESTDGFAVAAAELDFDDPDLVIDRLAIATASSDTTVRVWLAGSGRCLSLLKGHTDSVRSCQFRHDGQRIVSASWDGTVRVWAPLKSTQPVLTLRGDEGHVRSASYSPNGDRIASSGRDCRVRLWDVADDATPTYGTCVSIIEHPGHGFTAAFSPSGAHLVTASHSKVLHVYAVDSGKLLTTLNGHTAYCTSAQWTSDEKRIVSTSWDNTAKVWDVASGEVVRTLKHPVQCRAVTDAALGGGSTTSFVTCTTGAVALLWDLEMGDCIGGFAGHSDAVKAVAFAPAVELPGVPASAYGTVKDPFAARFVATASADCTWRVWDAHSTECLTVSQGHAARVNAAHLSPDGTQLVTVAGDFTGRLWSADTAECTAVLAGHDADVFEAAWSLDSRYVATCSGDKTVRLWCAATNVPVSEHGACRAVLLGHEDAVGAVAWNPAGSRVASASTDHTVRVWDPILAVCVAVLRGHGGYVLSVAFSADGTRLVSASTDRSVRVWSEDHEKALITLRGHNAYVTAAVFSADGAKVISAGNDQQLKCWDTLSGRCLASVPTSEKDAVEIVLAIDGSMAHVAFAAGAAASIALPRYVRPVLASSVVVSEPRDGGIAGAPIEPDGWGAHATPAPHRGHGDPTASTNKTPSPDRRTAVAQGRDDRNEDGGSGSSGPVPSAEQLVHELRDENMRLRTVLDETMDALLAQRAATEELRAELARLQRMHDEPAASNAPLEL
jgi:WD40 repeat protein